MTIPPSLPVSSKIIIRFRRRASINDARRINCAAARTFCVDLDSSAQIIVKPRELNVVYYDSDRSPCACFADGVATATQASVGQRTLTIAPEKAPIDDAAVSLDLRGKTDIAHTATEFQCPLLAQSGHPDPLTQCPLLGVKRASARHRAMSAFDLKRTSALYDCCCATNSPNLIFASRKSANCVVEITPTFMGRKRISPRFQGISYTVVSSAMPRRAACRIDGRKLWF